MKTERLLGIALFLQSYKKLTAKKLAEIFEVSIRTIYRDINSLCLAKVPVVALPGPEGGYSLMEGYKLTPNLFTSKELISLFLGGSVIEQVDPKAAIKQALIKIESILPEEPRREIREARKSILFDMTSWFGAKREDYLENLREAIFKRKGLLIAYPSHSRLASEERRISPYGLICKAGVWYLAAYCYKRRHVRTFRVDRIEKVEELEESFVIPGDFDVNRYWKESVKAYEEKQGEYHVKIKVDREMAGIARRYIWAGEKVIVQPDGSLIFQMDVDNFGYPTFFTLGFGRYAEVLEPKELRERVAQEAEWVIRRYKNARKRDK
ncbi:TPA: hypothetical protein DCX15_01700 [bacterium]|nr:hypothetical protein [bacterium]